MNQTMNDYNDFLNSKRMAALATGFFVDESDLNQQLFPWQRRVVQWALRRGRAALFEDCGLGKTPQQLDWAHHISLHTAMPVLTNTPLAVAEQTRGEGEKFGIPVTLCESQKDVRPGINVTNYEKLHRFDPDAFGGIVLDESSILKGFDGATRKALTQFSVDIPYRLACTATPAPNDLIEITNHAEFLGILSGKEILALFFTQDGNSTHAWRLKGHAREDFWQWMASWCVAMRKPSDLGFDDAGYVLPTLHMHSLIVEAPGRDGRLFNAGAQTLNEQRQARRETLSERVQRAVDLVNASVEPWVVWCDLNDESGALAAAIPGAVEVRGSDKDEHKARAMLDFAAGGVRVLVTKPSIAGFGMNWQHCANMAFVGVSHSYESFYQAVRRCYRFGQVRPVHCHLITSEADGAVVENLQRKEREANEMMDSVIRHMQDATGITEAPATREEAVYVEGTWQDHDVTLYLGDTIKRIKSVDDNSVGLSVFSPPFPGMYAYTNSPHDMGNTRNIDEMIAHFKYLIPDLLRVTMPGRTCALHLTQAVAFKGTDGYIGIKDFRGRVITAMEEAGWIYYGEVTIDKDPQVKAIRTKDRGLLFKTLATDSAHMHMALADYLLQFRKPGDNPTPIRAGVSEKYRNEDGWITADEWIEWAAPVWYRQSADYPGGIRETDVLNVAQARETDDERHLCPLQLGVIERAIKLWSAPGDVVFSPFLGIGSEAYIALKLRRRFIGCELKESYFKSAIRNAERALNERQQLSILELAA